MVKSLWLLEKRKKSGLNFLLRGLISTQIYGNIDSRGPSNFQKNFRKYQSGPSPGAHTASLGRKYVFNVFGSRAKYIVYTLYLEQITGIQAHGIYKKINYQKAYPYQLLTRTDPIHASLNP